MSNKIHFEKWYERFNRLSGDLYPGRYSRTYVGDLVETAKEVKTLARQKHSLIVAHNYVYPELKRLRTQWGIRSG